MCVEEGSVCLVILCVCATMHVCLCVEGVHMCLSVGWPYGTPSVTKIGKLGS